jgi:hypothetical protein
VNERQLCMAKDYFRSPYNEQGEMMFWCNKRGNIKYNMSHPKDSHSVTESSSM